MKAPAKRQMSCISNFEHIYHIFSSNPQPLIFSLKNAFYHLLRLLNDSFFFAYLAWRSTPYFFGEKLVSKSSSLHGFIGYIYLHRGIVCKWFNKIVLKIRLKKVVPYTSIYVIDTCAEE